MNNSCENRRRRPDPRTRPGPLEGAAINAQNQPCFVHGNRTGNRSRGARERTVSAGAASKRSRNERWPRHPGIVVTAQRYEQTAQRTSLVVTAFDDADLVVYRRAPATGAYGPLQSGYDEFWGVRGGGVDYFTHKFGPFDDLWDGQTPVKEVSYLTDLLGGSGDCRARSICQGR